MCAIDPASASVAMVYISAASAATSAVMGIVSMQQQAAAAQANLNAQAQMQQNQMQQQRQQMIMQQQQQRAAMLQNQELDRQNRLLSQQQGQQAYNLQVQQANNQMLTAYQQQQKQVLNERAQLMRQNEIDRLAFQRGKEQADEQTRLNNEAANRTYLQEQTKLGEARKKAAFEQQAILAKSIGAKGRILAAGRTGQSIGLLVNDVERQAGFASAQEAATLDSKETSAAIGMDSAFIRAQSMNNQAYSNIPFQPQDPYLPAFPDAPNFVGLDIPTYT